MRRLATHIFIADTWQLLKSVPRHEVSREHFKWHIIQQSVHPVSFWAFNDTCSLVILLIVACCFRDQTHYPMVSANTVLPSQTENHMKHQTLWEIYIYIEWIRIHILLVKVLYFPILLKMLSKDTLVQVTFRCCYAFPTLTDSYKSISAGCYQRE